MSTLPRWSNPYSFGYAWFDDRARRIERCMVIVDVETGEVLPWAVPRGFRAFYDAEAVHRFDDDGRDGPDHIAILTMAEQDLERVIVKFLLSVCEQNLYALYDQPKHAASIPMCEGIVDALVAREAVFG